MPLCGLYAGMALIVSRVLLGKEQKDDIRVDELRDIVSVSTRTSHRITRVTEVTHLKHRPILPDPCFNIYFTGEQNDL